MVPFTYNTTTFLFHTLIIRSFSNIHPIRATPKLIGVARTALEFRSHCRSVTVWTTTIFCVLAPTAICLWTTGSCCIVWTTAISTVLAATTCKYKINVTLENSYCQCIRLCPNILSLRAWKGNFISNITVCDGRILQTIFNKLHHKYTINFQIIVQGTTYNLCGCVQLQFKFSTYSDILSNIFVYNFPCSLIHLCEHSFSLFIYTVAQSRNSTILSIHCALMNILLNNK